MHNEIYDMDKKLCFSDCSNSMSVPSPCSSQSSMSSSTSGYSTSSPFHLPNQNFPRYDISGGDINMTLQAQNLNRMHSMQSANINMPVECADYTSQLVILEQPTEKFRFRYKSEMHGTHGSLNGERSEKNKKTFPEVELKNFTGMGVIRCSLYQTNLDKPSPHSHQLVVRKDDMDECDPHDVHVSPEKGYIARFENMGIIHTAKKNICDALYAKKKQKMRFETGCEELSQRQEKVLRDEAEREGKLMNLNQVRLCFEAFKIVDGGKWSRICEPVYSRPINNRKSALTGELKICRLSSVVGSAAGGEDLILLVEKVSKKNIQVRFYELRDDDQVWEAFGDFSDADVHHQYAIVVRTPPYKNKDIDTNVSVYIELVRKSDDERSAPLNFRYKPQNIVLSRKRRRTSYQSTSSPLNSDELPVPVAKCLPQQQQQQRQQQQPQSISQEYNKDEQLNSLLQPADYECQYTSYMHKVVSDSDELKNIIYSPDFFDNMLNIMQSQGELETDCGTPINARQREKFSSLETNDTKSQQQHHPAMKLFISAIRNKALGIENIVTKVRGIFEEYSTENESGDTIVHDIVKQGQQSDAMMLFNILSKLNLTDLLCQTNNLGQTPLHISCIFDKPLFIRPLLGLKCDPNIQDTEGNTALHIAIAENLKECVESFVSYISASSDNGKLNINLSNDSGFTPLHLAIRQNNIGFAQTLLTKCNASAKIASSRDGNNALHLAVQHQNKNMVKCLLENSKVNVNAKNRSGHTAIDLAKSMGGEVKREILGLLLAKMPPSNDDADPITSETIKEEPDEDNDSSTEEDDEKSLSSEPEERTEEMNLKQLLQDEKVCRHLGQLLNVDNKWKKLGSELKLDHLLCLWGNAEVMLQYLVAADEVDALKLWSALQTVDAEAASIVTSLMKT